MIPRTISIDRHVAKPDASERYRLDVTASVDTILQAAAVYRPHSDPFIRRMIALRESPMRIGRLLRVRRDAALPPLGMDIFPP